MYCRILNPIPFPDVDLKQGDIVKGDIQKNMIKIPFKKHVSFYNANHFKVFSTKNAALLFDVTVKEKIIELINEASYVVVTNRDGIISWITKYSDTDLYSEFLSSYFSEEIKDMMSIEERSNILSILAVSYSFTGFVIDYCKEVKKPLIILDENSTGEVTQLESFSLKFESIHLPVPREVIWDILEERFGC